MKLSWRVCGWIDLRNHLIDTVYEINWDWHVWLLRERRAGCWARSWCPRASTWTWWWSRRSRGPSRSHLTQSVCKVVLQKWIPTQIRQLTLYISKRKGWVDDFVGELTFSNHSVNTSCEIRSPSNPSQLITRPDTVVSLGTVDRSGDISCQQLSAIPMALRNPCRRVLGVKL